MSEHKKAGVHVSSLVAAPEASQKPPHGQPATRSEIRTRGPYLADSSSAIAPSNRARLGKLQPRGGPGGRRRVLKTTTPPPPPSLSISMAAKPGAVYAEATEPLVLPRHDQQPPPAFYGVPVSDYPEDQPLPLPPPSPQPYLLIPLYRDRRRRMGFRGGRPRGCCGAVLSPAALRALLLAGILLGVAGFLLWPSDPEVRLAKLKLRSIKVSTKHKGTLVALDIAMDLRVWVRNRAFFGLGYDNVTVGIEYRGRPLGTAVAVGGTVEARGESYAAAKLRLDGIRVLEDALFLIEDLLKGNIPFDTVTQLDGDLRFLSFEIPIQGRISCAINVDVENQIIASQDCYPEQQKDLRNLAERTSRDTTALRVSPSSSVKPSPKGTSYSLT